MINDNFSRYFICYTYTTKWLVISNTLLFRPVMINFYDYNPKTEHFISNIRLGFWNLC